MHPLDMHAYPLLFVFHSFLFTYSHSMADKYMYILDTCVTRSTIHFRSFVSAEFTFIFISTQRMTIKNSLQLMKFNQM
jgi:hypothetical protein